MRELGGFWTYRRIYIYLNEDHQGNFEINFVCA